MVNRDKITMITIARLITALDRYDRLLHNHITEDISDRNNPELEAAARELNKTINEALKVSAVIAATIQPDIDGGGLVKKTPEQDEVSDDIENAIAYMEEMRSLCDTQAGNVPKAYDASIAALREKQARNKRCALCKEMPITIHASTVENGGGAMTFYATYCPICGAQLKSKNCEVDE